MILLLSGGSIDARFSFYDTKRCAELSQEITPELPGRTVGGMWQDTPETDGRAFISAAKSEASI